MRAAVSGRMRDKLCVAWLLVVSCVVSRWVVLVAGDLEQVCVHGQNVQNGLCGEQLSGLLKLICGTEGYNGFQKRSTLAPYPADRAILDENNLLGHKVFLPRQNALSTLGSSRARRGASGWDVVGGGHGYQGIVCECCYNRCGIMELKQYCAQSNIYGGGKRTRPVRNRRHRFLARAHNSLMRRRWEIVSRDAENKLGQPVTQAREAGGMKSEQPLARDAALNLEQELEEPFPGMNDLQHEIQLGEEEGAGNKLMGGELISEANNVLGRSHPEIHPDKPQEGGEDPGRQDMNIMNAELMAKLPIRASKWMERQEHPIVLPESDHGAERLLEEELLAPPRQSGTDQEVTAEKESILVNTGTELEQALMNDPAGNRHEQEPIQITELNLSVPMIPKNDPGALSQTRTNKDRVDRIVEALHLVSKKDKELV